MSVFFYGNFILWKYYVAIKLSHQKIILSLHANAEHPIPMDDGYLALYVSLFEKHK